MYIRATACPHHLSKGVPPAVASQAYWPTAYMLWDISQSNAAARSVCSYCLMQLCMLLCRSLVHFMWLTNLRAIAASNLRGHRSVFKPEG